MIRNAKQNTVIEILKKIQPRADKKAATVDNFEDSTALSDIK